MAPPAESVKKVNKLDCISTNSIRHSPVWFTSGPKMRRLVSLGRMVQRCNAPKQLTQTSNRFSSHYVGYRELNYDGGRVHQKYLGEGLAGIMYWWIGWNLMTDWRHLIGEFIWPQRSEWTDEELGVPQD